MAEWKVKPSCPFKEMITNIGGKLKRGFSCEVCLINPEFCSRYRQATRTKKDKQKEDGNDKRQ